MKPCNPLLATLLLASAASIAAQSKPVTKKPVQLTETVVVLGTATPVPLADTSRAIEILPVALQSLKFQTPIDALRTDSSVFLEQRGAGGAQSDIVLRGGGFSQTLVLLNGFRVNDSQSGHHNLDLPLPLDAVDSIQVLHGAGSTLHGVDALAGVVDFLTAAPAETSLRLRAAAGNFGINEQSVRASLVRTRFSTRLSTERNFSTGFIADRNYRNESAASEYWLNCSLGLTDIFLAGSDRAFGADQFYGPYPSWERTKGWFASARQELGTRTSAAFAFRRHTDEFVLIRSNPSIYENNHITTSWQAMLHRTQQFSSAAILAGLDADGDAINSNNLGRHARNRGAGYLDLDLRPAKRRWTLSTGLRTEIFSGGAQVVWSPHLAGSMRLGHQVKLRADAGYGYRIPSYTDLYYSDPTTNGNANLKPESSWSGEGGIDWTPTQKFSLSATGFYARQHDTIDYVRASAADKWQAVNLSGLRFGGIETALTWLPMHNQHVGIAWTALHGAQSALHGLQSEYVFNYPVQNIHTEWTTELPHSIVLSNSIQLAQRYQQSVYPVWNLALLRGAGRIQPFVRLANLSNTGYAEINNVPMPGRTITAGLQLTLGK
ncbi:MAG: TonB-dependent receptor [Acidobacteriota bacterium]|nr:TonB-dependent receptor [Acidobacteriota bacterium]